jgi:hypothetical protein
MKPSLRLVPLALLLAAAAPLPSLADSASECRQAAREDEVAAEDLEDYLAECMAAVDSESGDAAAAEAPEGDAPTAGGGR